MEKEAKGKPESAKLTFTKCPECRNDLFNLTPTRQLKCIKCGHLFNPPRNFNIVTRRGNFYPHK
jgi:ribosomal protein S27E